MTETVGSTRERLLDHAARYPKAEAQDYMKYLYQSAFGCEHLIADPSAAAAYIRREAATALKHGGDVTEPLDGPFCRVFLDVLESGLTPETLAALFVLSSEHQEEGTRLLEEKLGVLMQLVDAGEVPLDCADTEAKLRQWREAGYPACHHSESFRKVYAPAYRLMKADYARFLPLFARIDQHLAESGCLTVVIDGGSASGKSTLAALLSRVYDCNVFHMDDFFLRPEQRTPERYAEPGGNVDRERFLEEVLLPLRAGQDVTYRRFDCGSMSLMAAITVPAKKLNVIEGSYSLHPALRSQDQLSVFLKICPQKQIERVLKRNGPQVAQQYRERWIPLENKYLAAFHPDEQCDLLIEV